jgi:hypothetical protein
MKLLLKLTVLVEQKNKNDYLFVEMLDWMITTMKENLILITIHSIVEKVLMLYRDLKLKKP